MVCVQLPLESSSYKIFLPVLVAFAIPAQKAIAVCHLVRIAAAFAGTVAVRSALVKVRAFGIVRLSTPAIVRAGVKPVVVTAIVNAKTVVLIVVRIIDRAVRNGLVVSRRLITLVAAIVTMAAPISMAIPPTAAIAIPITISSVSTTSITWPSTASGIAATGIVATRITGGRIPCSCAPRNDYLTRLSFNHTIATIAAAIPGHCSPYAATVFVRRAVVVVSAIIVIASRRPAVIVPTSAAVRCWIRARCFRRRT